MFCRVHYPKWREDGDAPLATATSDILYLKRKSLAHPVDYYGFSSAIARKKNRSINSISLPADFAEARIIFLEEVRQNESTLEQYTITGLTIVEPKRVRGDNTLCSPGNNRFRLLCLLHFLNTSLIGTFAKRSQSFSKLFGYRLACLADGFQSW